MVYLSKKDTMIKKCTVLLVCMTLFSCAELQEAVNQLPESTSTISNTEIAAGLRAALDQGIDKQVSKLTQTDGFYKNNLVKILLPEELQKVDKTLRDIGLGSLADEGFKVLNRAAEDAVATATPIFVNAVIDITFADANASRWRNDDAATRYLAGSTEAALYTEFHTVINAAFRKVRADQIWSNLINKSHALPFTSNGSPDLAD